MGSLLLRLAGVDRQVLDRVPQDRAKYVGMGGAVLTTAGLAVVSSSLALQMALHASAVVAVVFGLLWGMAILSLDRWLVASNQHGGGWRRTVAVAIPRLVLALVIGAVMSTPLVLRIFAPEIASELTVMHQQDRATFAERIAADPRYKRMDDEQRQVVQLQEQIATPPSDADVLADPGVRDVQTQLDAVSKEYDTAEQAVVCEKEGTCGSGHVGAGPAYREKVQRRDRLAAQVVTLKQQLASTTARVRDQLDRTHGQLAVDAKQRLAQLQADVTRLQQQRSQEIAAHDATVRDDHGLLARLEALHRLTAQRPELATAHWALFLLLTLIECLPVAVKVLLALGGATAYERLVAAEQDEVVRERELRRDAHVAELQAEVDAHLDTLKRTLRVEAETAEKVARDIARHQVQLADRATHAWRQEHEARLPDAVREFVAHDEPVAEPA